MKILIWGRTIQKVENQCSRQTKIHGNQNISRERMSVYSMNLLIHYLIQCRNSNNSSSPDHAADTLSEIRNHFPLVAANTIQES